MIFLPLSSARHGVESCSAMRLARASCSRRSESSCCENLNPCAPKGPGASKASRASIAKAQLGRIDVRTVPGAEGGNKPVRIAQRGPEIHMAYSTGRRQDRDSRASVAKRLRLRRLPCTGQLFRFSLKKAMVRDHASLAAASSYRGVVSL